MMPQSAHIAFWQSRHQYRSGNLCVLQFLSRSLEVCLTCYNGKDRYLFNFCDEASAVSKFREDMVAVGTEMMLLKVVFDTALAENLRAV